MMDTESREFTEKTLAREGNEYTSFIQPWKVEWSSASKPPEQCSGSWNC